MSVNIYEIFIRGEIMSFERLDRDNTLDNGARSCVLLCNFNAKEIKAVKNYASILGLKDQICLNSKNGNSIIKDILEDNIDSNCEIGRKESKLETAKLMKAEGLPAELIAKITGLTTEEIENL